jgi:hypothetical protein
MQNLFRRFTYAAALLLFLVVPASAQQKPAPAQKPWWERITFGGDFRGRYEGFYQDDRETRHRERFRLRVSLTTPIHDEVTFGLRLASGVPTDLTSTNQSFTDFLNRKAINLDQMFLTYTPKAAKGLTIGGGKFGYPITRTQMVWDDDLNWEGTYQQYAWSAADRTSFRLTAVQSPINELSADDDSFMFAWNGQVSQKVGAHTVQLSVADYQFVRVDAIAVAVDARGLSNPLTNFTTRNAAGRVTGFLSDFNLLDVIAQATLVTKRADYPVTLLLDWVKNTEAETDEDTGVWLSAAYGRAARPKTWAATYTFARIERDAVLSTYNFSDIPPTDTRMNLFAVSYMPVARLNLDVTAILTKPIHRANTPSDNLLKRVQADVRVSF